MLGDSFKDLIPAIKEAINNLPDLSEQNRASANAAGEEKAKELKIDTEEFKAYRDMLAEAHKELEEIPEALNDVALANKRMEKGVKDLAKDWTNINKLMKDPKTSMEDLSDIMPTVRQAIGDIANIDIPEDISPEFIKKN